MYLLLSLIDISKSCYLLIQVATWAGNLMLNHAHNNFPSDIYLIFAAANAQLVIGEYLIPFCCSFYPIKLIHVNENYPIGLKPTTSELVPLSLCKLSYQGNLFNQPTHTSCISPIARPLAYTESAVEMNLSGFYNNYTGPAKRQRLFLTRGTITVPPLDRVDK